jgi:hypothetical protein
LAATICQYLLLADSSGILGQTLLHHSSPKHLHQHPKVKSPAWGDAAKCQTN